MCKQRKKLCLLTPVMANGQGPLDTDRVRFRGIR